MSLCIINEPGKVFGSALVAKRWKDIFKRKEYNQFRKPMLFVLKSAEKYRLYCPNIYIKNSVLHICYSIDDRYVNFYIETSKRISYEYWVSGEERTYYVWSDKSRMVSISAFVNGE